MSALAEIRRRFQTDGTGLLSQEYIDPQVVTSPQEAFMQISAVCHSGKQKVWSVVNL